MPFKVFVQKYEIMTDLLADLLKIMTNRQEIIRIWFFFVYLQNEKFVFLNSIPY